MVATYDPSLNQLRDTLAQMYPEKNSARLVAESAGLDITNIPLDGDPRNRWHAILRHAYLNMQVEDIISVVSSDSPNNSALKDAVDAYRKGRKKEKPPDPVIDLYSRENQVRLQEILEDRFLLEELQKLTFRLGIEYENIEGTTIAGKTRELVRYLVCRNQLEDLVRVGSELRPDIKWTWSVAKGIENARSQVSPSYKQEQSLKLQLFNRKLDSHYTQLQIQMSNLNKYEIERAKYGSERIPVRLEFQIEDTKSEIKRTEDEIQQIKAEISELDN